MRQRPVVSNMSQQSYRYSLSIFCVSHTGISSCKHPEWNTTENDDEDVVDDKAVVVVALPICPIRYIRGDSCGGERRCDHALRRRPYYER